MLGEVFRRLISQYFSRIRGLHGIRGVRCRATLVLEKGGRRIVDEDLVKLLILIDRTGSLLSASSSLGLSYSRAWEAVARLERALGTKVVEAKRGGRRGGGAALTDYGRKLVEYYVSEYRRVLKRRLSVRSARFEAPELIYAGSNDVLLEHLFGMMRSHGVEFIEIAWIGSSGGLSSLMLGEADLAGIHLYDEETGQYNVPFISRYWLEEKVVLIRGYERELGFAYKAEIRDPLKALVEGKARLVNRNLGSGTRVYLDYLLRREAEARGVAFRELVRSIKGYENEVSTHLDVAKAIALGRADIGLTLRWVAVKYGLRFKPVRWENFDFAVSLEKLEKKPLKAFLEVLRSEELRETAEKVQGYRLPQDLGKVVQPSG
ncbi:MAG: LysR family transcriptional regulator [Thaumarchaeota archaeon]|nr:LysR family transcriptional regulator [Nitrososphaerota archaeon]